MVKYNFSTIFLSLIKNNYFVYFICILAGSLYCLGLTLGATFIQNIYTIIFIMFLIFLVFVNLIKISKDKNLGPGFIFIQLFVLNLSIAFSGQFFKSPNSFFWVQDSVLTHLPESLKFTSFFQGQTPPNLGIYSGRGTHATTGLFLLIFGVNTFSTICAQLFFKMITVFFIYLISLFFWDCSVALLAIQLYGFCPTIFFYNLVLYKESAVHAFVAGLIFFSLKFFLEKKYLYFIPMALVFGLLLRERFYIAYLMSIMFVLLTYNLPFKKNARNHSIIFAMALIAAAITYKFNLINISATIKELVHYRSLHSNFADVMNQYNYNIPYPLAFIKILFSPYFSFNKFKIFTDFSTLLTWGSFTNQFIILSAVLGFFKLVKQKIFHLYIWAPFISFLLLCAYITPWSGRLRDSFYPIIACYAAFYIVNNRYFKKLFILNEK